MSWILHVRIALLSIIFITGLFKPDAAHAQCGANTPSFTVDMTGKPDSVWLSPQVVRNDTCCGASGSDRCIEFIVTLDTNAVGIILDIYSGAIPPGALYYYVACGSPTSIGTPLCLNGPGPHRITFCKPGNNDNVYRLRSVPNPKGPDDIKVRDGCRGVLTATGYIDSTITWQSLGNNSTYNSFLSCASGCATTYVTPISSNFPPYVDYVVCGNAGNQCKSIAVCDTVRVHFYSELKVDIAPDSPAVCYGATSALLKARPSGGYTPYRYLWSTGSTDSMIYVGQGTYWVMLSDSTNCPPVFDTVEVKSFTLPIMAMAGNDTDICAGSSIQLNGAVQIAEGGRWIGGTGTFSPSRSDLNAIYTPSAAERQAGKVVLILLTTGNRTCQPDYDTIVVNIRPYPQPKITGPAAVCERTSGHTYQATLNTGSTYTWSVAGGSILSGQGTPMVQVSWSNSGTGTIMVNEMNTWGCDSTVKLTVQINPKPLPLISGSSQVCRNARGTVYQVQANAGSTYQWTIQNGIISSGSNSNAVTVKWLAAGTGTLTVKETNSYGCDTIVSFSITVLPEPAPVITGNPVPCNRTQEVYSAVPVQGAHYEWNISGGQILSGQGSAIIKVEWIAIDTGSVILRQISANGCDSVTKLNIRLVPRPQPAIAGPEEACQHSTDHSYSATYNPGSKYQWSISGGTIVYGAGTASVIVNWGKEGFGTISVTETNYSGCDSTVSKIITIYPKPLPSVNGPSKLCEGATGATYKVFLSGVSRFSWRVDGGILKSDSTATTISVDWPKPGQHSVRLYAENDLGCDTLMSFTVLVYKKPDTRIVGPEQVCEHTTLHKYSTSTSDNGSSFNWQISGGSIISGQTTSSVTVAWGERGIGTISVREVNPNNCENFASLSIQVEKLHISIRTDQKRICAPSPVYFEAEPDTGLVTFFWDFGDGHTSEDARPVHIYMKEGEYEIILISRNKIGCFDTAHSSVTVYPGPLADFEVKYPRPDNIIYFDEDTARFHNLSNGGIKYYVWDFGDGTTDSLREPTHRYAAPGEYKVKLHVTNTLGCVDSIEKIVVVSAKTLVYIPNAFSPNNDGVNDFFSIAVTNLEDFQILIFNRWGEIIYRSTDPDFKWDGRFRGMVVQEGVYGYLASGKGLAGGSVKESGCINILK